MEVEFDPRQFAGTLVLTLEGKIESSSGELENDAKTAEICIQLLKDTNSFITAGNKPKDAFKRLTVTFERASYVMTIANGRIYVAKKPTI